MGWGWSLSGMGYGAAWRARRRIVQHYFHLGEKGIATFSDRVRSTNVELLRAILETPEKVFAHLRWCVRIPRGLRFLTMPGLPGRTS